MKLVRDNFADPRVVRDLERLSGEQSEASGESGEAAAREASQAAAAAAFAAKFDQEIPPGAPTPFSDPFVRRFVIATSHVKRYLPFYAGGLAWIGVMLLIQPFGQREQLPDQFAARPAALSPAASATQPDTVVDAAPLAAPGDTLFDTFDPTVTAPAEIAVAEPSPAVEPPTFDDSTFASDDIEVDDEPRELAIVRSGYASRTGGTPLEQEPPADGLPVSAAAGEEVKLSFIALAGDFSVLRLKELPDSGANANADQAAIRACPIQSADWEAARGIDVDDAPAYDTACVTGIRSAEGIWEFDLMDFGLLDDHPGFVLVATPHPTSNFQVTFAPAALPQTDAATVEAEA